MGRKMNEGGVALLWRKSLANCIVPLELNDDRIIGIQLQISPSDYIVIYQVYLPCANYSNDCIRNLFLSFMICIASIVSPSVIVEPHDES